MTRLQLVVFAFFVGNLIGLVAFGLNFLLVGWAINIPSGLLHYFVIEQPHGEGDPRGAALICAVPWAQTLLTAVVILGALVWLVAWWVQQAWVGWWGGEPVDEDTL